MRKRVFKLFFVWQDESEEQWLTRMAKDGWYLKKYNIFYYLFEKGNPAEVIFKLDYQTDIEDFVSYREIFEESGWNYVTSYLGWHYFCGKKNELFVNNLYTDRESTIQKYRRILQTLSVLFLVVLISNFPFIILAEEKFAWFSFIPMITLIILIIAILRVQINIKKISKFHK